MSGTVSPPVGMSAADAGPWWRSAVVYQVYPRLSSPAGTRLAGPRAARLEPLDQLVNGRVESLIDRKSVV